MSPFESYSAAIRWWNGSARDRALCVLIDHGRDAPEYREFRWHGPHQHSWICVQLPRPEASA